MGPCKPSREAFRVKVFMKLIDQREKTLVFCSTQEHAGLIRDPIIRRTVFAIRRSPCLRAINHQCRVYDRHGRQAAISRGFAGMATRTAHGGYVELTRERCAQRPGRPAPCAE